MPHLPASQALSRFRVVDMTQVRAGPTAARQLADWGADVIQVQMPEHMRGDDTLGGQEGSDYQYTHRNKRSITLNLKEPEGIAVLKKLVETADVLVENFRPDVKTRLGIDYETLAQINPRLVYASISGFGQTGPYATRPGFDQIAQAMGAPEWITDERSKTKSNRSVHRDWLNAEIEQRLLRNTSNYWIATLNEAGVACGRINNLKEVFEEPQMKHLGMLKKVTSMHLGEQTLMGQPVTLARTPSTIA